MGTRQRPRPDRLAEKLLAIRLKLSLSQTEMVERLGNAGLVFRSSVSAFERGTHEPSLPVLLRYARLAGVSTDVLIDDDLDLS